MENIIICGDCFDEMEKLTDNSIDLIVSDPPWNCKKDFGVYKDNLTKSEYTKFIKRLKDLFERKGKGKVNIILGSKVLKKWWDVFSEYKLIIIKVGAIVRPKENNLHLQYKCLLTSCTSPEFGTDLWCDIRWPGEGYFYNEERYGHPCSTPLKLIRRIIRLFSNENDLVMDPFLGSGTSAVACKQLKRRFIGFDTNPEYIKTARKRLIETDPLLHQRQMILC